MPEKLLSIKEVAEYLKVSEDEIKRLVDTGIIPAYRIGGSFLRFRREQIDGIMSEINRAEGEEPERGKVKLDGHGHPTHPYTDLERDIKKKEPVVRQYDYTAAERIRDFIYFYDFYIISFAVIFTLIYLIFRR